MVQSFEDWLMSRIKTYRLEVMSDYVESPLRLGVGAREFELLDIYFPVIPVGPTGKPVPGGAGVTSAGVPKYPYETKQSRDILMAGDYRNTRLYDSDVEGNEIVPDDENLRWHYDEKAITFSGGTGAVTNMMSAKTGYKAEAMIFYVNILPHDSTAVVSPRVVVVADTGSMLGAGELIYFSYIYDATNEKFHGITHLTFPQGKHFKTNSSGAKLQVGGQNGVGSEVLCVGYAWRYVSS